MKEKLNLRKKEIMAYLVITILAIVIIVTGASYAFFTANVRTENDANKTITGEAKTLVEVHMDYGSEIKSEGMYPGHKVVKTIHITGSGKESSTPVPIKIQLTPEVADFPNHVRYSIYAVENSSIDINSVCGEANNQTSTDKYYDAMECDTSKLGNVLKSGIFVDKEKESYETLVEYNTDRTFYILVEYINDTEKDQNSEQNKSFKITLSYEGEVDKRGTLRAVSGTSDTTAFYQYKSDITKVVFEDTMNPKETELFWDVSESQDGSVMSYLVPNEEDASKYTLYIQSKGGVKAPKYCRYLFSDFVNLTTIEGLELLDTSQVKDMAYMFNSCERLISLDLSGFDTSNVTDMVGMFQYCSSLTNLDLSSFDLSNSYVERMFNGVFHIIIKVKDEATQSSILNSNVNSHQIFWTTENVIIAS